MFCIFSERQLGSQARISPCGQFIACLCPDGQGASRLQIRSLRSGLDKTGRTSEYMRVTNLFQCVDKIDSFEISSDSQFVLCCMLARSAVQVFSLVDSSWKCRINEGVAGLTAAWWAPDATRIVTESDFGVHMSVWSLRDATSSIISLPKPILSLSGGQHSPISITRTNSGAGGKGNACRNAAFSPCGRFLAVLHRSDLQDKIAVYAVGTSGGGADGSDCGEISRFKCRPGTSSGSSDIAAICWITNPSVAADPALPLPADTSDPHPRGVSFSAQLIAVDSPLAYRFSVYTPMGELLASYEAYQGALGIKALGILDSPSLAKSDAVGAAIKFVAIGSYDGKVRLLSQFSWKLAFTLPLIHPKDMEAGLRPPSFGGKGQAEGAEGESLDGSSVLDPQYGSAIGEGSLLLVVEIPGTRVQASHLAQAAMSAHRSTASSVATSSIADSTVVGSVMTLGRDDNFRIVAAGGLEAHDADDAAGAADPTLRHARAGKLRTKLRRSIAAAPLSGSAASGISKVTNNLPLTEKSLSLIANNPQLDDSFSRGIEGDTSNIDDEDDNDDTCFAPQNLSELPSTSAAGKTTAQRGTTAGSDPLTSRSKQTGPTSSAPMGVSWVSFSSDNQVLAAREDRYPRCLWLWQPHKAQLISILVMMENVSCAQWNNSCRHQHHEQQCSDGIGSEEENVASSNTVGASSEYQHGIDDSASADYEGPILAFCTGTSRVYFWTSKWGPVYAPVPKLAASQSSHRSAPRGAKAAPGSGSGKFSVTRLQWSSTVRNRLILSGKESHCVCDVQFDSLSIRRKAKMKLSGGK